MVALMYDETKQVEFFLVYTFPFDDTAGRVGSGATRRRCCDGGATARRGAAGQQWHSPVATPPATVAPALWLFGMALL